MFALEAMRTYQLTRTRCELLLKLLDRLHDQIISEPIDFDFAQEVRLQLIDTAEQRLIRVIERLGQLILRLPLTPALDEMTDWFRPAPALDEAAVHARQLDASLAEVNCQYDLVMMFQRHSWGEREYWASDNWSRIWQKVKRVGVEVGNSQFWTQDVVLWIEDVLPYSSSDSQAT